MQTGQRSIYKHRLPVRLSHWLNVICFFILLGSGLNIFNAHPKLYWGKISTFEIPAFSISANTSAKGERQGVTQIGSHKFNSTGVLGVSNNRMGNPVEVGFPGWSTIPSGRNLADARLWHFFFAWLFVINGLLFLLWAWRSKHYGRDLHPTGSDWRGIFKSIWDHMRFKHPEGDEAVRYNILQKLAYVSVIYIFLPGLVLMGLCMSPHMGSVLDWLLDLVGGRQSARTLHFIFAGLMVAFIGIHIFMVLVSGPINQIRSMITGRFKIHDAAVAEENEEKLNVE
jgi:thiosulfate reductase cytochrome b subunit